MNGRILAGGLLVSASAVLAGFAMVHSRGAGERARDAERRLQDLTERLAKLESAVAIPAGSPVAAGVVDSPGGDLERRMDEKSRAPGRPETPGASPDSASPSTTPATSPRGRQAWAALAPDDRRAVLELVKEAQKELRQEEIWGWATGIQARFTKSMREKLQLTPVQEERVSAVLRTYLPEMNKVWHNPEGTPEERAAKSNELWSKVDGEISPLLTGEQAISYEEWRKEQEEKAKKHAESGGR
ncbi:MAG: hypothetical protein FD180_4317 [Planctomycetota bacterium]|nr:MAG: hypothetical protein FD180_4317 [Planctomycetota bacterium]